MLTFLSIILGCVGATVTLCLIDRLSKNMASSASDLIILTADDAVEINGTELADSQLTSLQNRRAVVCNFSSSDYTQDFKNNHTELSSNCILVETMRRCQPYRIGSHRVLLWCSQKSAQ